MSQWGSAKARKVLAALLRIGWTIKRESHGSHRILSRPGWPDVVFAFHDAEEIGPRIQVFSICVPEAGASRQQDTRGVASLCRPYLCTETISIRFVEFPSLHARSEERTPHLD